MTFPTKAKITNLETKEEITVQFNPTELTFNKTAQFAEIAIPGLDSPVLQFIRGGNETFTLELFFDTTDRGMSGEDVKSVDKKYVEKFYRLVKQNPNKHAPPRCLFHWGVPKGDVSELVTGIRQQYDSNKKKQNQENEGGDVSYVPHWFTCVVESIERKYLLFSPEGVPLRARLTVKLREYQTIEQMVANLKSADHTRTQVLKRSERLDQISNQSYDTPAEWRRIAEVNDIDDPRRVQPGTVLTIPPLRPGSIFQGGR